jgi:hypothetical protein
MQKLPEERISDKFRNYLSIFLSFDELSDTDLEQKDFILSVHDSMTKEYRKMTKLASEINNPDLTEKLNKFAIPIIILKNYIDGYKTKENVVESKRNLDLENHINSIIELLEK